MAKTTAIYCRVSTHQQKLDSQEDELKRWVELHRPLKVKWFRDKCSGKTMHRVGMQKILELLQSNRLEAIVVWRLDRLGRTASGLIKLFDDLRIHKCNLISLMDNLDLSTSSGRLHCNIIASVANYETELRAERIRAGQQAARLRGKRIGGSVKGVRKRKVEAKMKAVLALLEQGVPKVEIARTVGISVPTIYSIIRENSGRK